VSEAVTLVSSSDDDFQYNPEYKVLIYKKCKYTIRGLETHLEDTYRLKKKERRPLLDRYNILLLVKPEDIHTPLLNRRPFKALRDPIPAFQCLDYNHISINRKSIRGHYNKAYD
jgi:hypothetical protein